MPAISASAPGKIILLGEHAVVYGRPAIAVPVTQVRARVTATANLTGAPGQVWITAKNIALACSLSELPPEHPFVLAVQGVMNHLGIQKLPALNLQISSTIPIASGLGSGAAVSAAIARALSAFLGHPLADDQVSQIAFVCDQKYHGTPSGIDNTVIAYAKPIFFIRGMPFQPLRTARPFTIVIGDSGVSSPTSDVVDDVRQRWLAAPAPYENLFDKIGAAAAAARDIIENGPMEQLGPLLTHNHALLQELDVSSPQLDQLVDAALQAGAAGAKLCGGGRGGNMIALASADDAAVIAAALTRAGAVRTIITMVGNP